MLVECDPSIKSLIINLDGESNAYVIEDLDETHLLVKENMLQELKAKLDDVSWKGKNHHHPNTDLLSQVDLTDPANASMHHRG